MDARREAASTTPRPGGGRPRGWDPHTPDVAVAAHTRPGLLRSIRIRMLLPVVLATVGLAVLGYIQTDTALAQARQGERARVLANTSNAIVALVHQMQQEYVETNALRQRGGTAGAELLNAQRRRTDTARTGYVVAARAARDAVPSLGPAFAEADALLDLVPAGRERALTVPGSVEVFTIYREATARLLAVAQAIPVQLTDPDLVVLSRSIALTAELEHSATEQLDLLRRAFTARQLTPGELIRLAGIAGNERERLAELLRLPGPAAASYNALVNGPDVDLAKVTRDAVLNASGSPSLSVDPDVWYIAQSGHLRRLRMVQVELAAQMEQASYAVRIGAQRTAVLTAVLTGGLVLFVLIGAGVLAVRTVRRLRRMRQAALTVARTELPNAISEVTTAGDADKVRSALHEASTRIDAMFARSGDEIGELASAFGTVHRQALRLAADQALLRMDVEGTLVGLSRRGQTLVQRQIQLIEQYGDGEDPRPRLFALNHLAARMRRNEENLLVLAGGEPGRRFIGPVPLLHVLRSAAEEIEDYHRVEAMEIPPVAVSAVAVRDVIHLLAELLENAANFSPPRSTVRLSSRATLEGITLTVYDEGIGIPAAKVAEANERLAHASGLTSSLVRTMGLLVVARLAERHGIRVQLHSTAGAGTAATVTLPESMLVPALSNTHAHRAAAILPPRQELPSRHAAQVYTMAPPRRAEVRVYDAPPAFVTETVPLSRQDTPPIPV